MQDRFVQGFAWPACLLHVAGSRLRETNLPNTKTCLLQQCIQRNKRHIHRYTTFLHYPYCRLEGNRNTVLPHLKSHPCDSRRPKGGLSRIPWRSRPNLVPNAQPLEDLVLPPIENESQMCLTCWYGQDKTRLRILPWLRWSSQLALMRWLRCEVLILTTFVPPISFVVACRNPWLAWKGIQYSGNA